MSQGGCFGKIEADFEGLSGRFGGSRLVDERDIATSAHKMRHTMIWKQRTGRALRRARYTRQWDHPAAYMMYACVVDSSATLATEEDATLKGTRTAGGCDGSSPWKGE